jgi:hypothetical protein
LKGRGNAGNGAGCKNFTDCFREPQACGSHGGTEKPLVEAADALSSRSSETNHLVKFYKSSLENDLKFFHTLTSDRVKAIFLKYLSIDVTEAGNGSHYDPTRVRSELNKIAKKRRDIAHRSWRPIAGQPTPHAVTREDLRKSIRFIKNLVGATDAFTSKQL